MALTEEQQEDADLEAGFTKSPPATTEKPVEVKVEVAAPEPEVKPPVVEYVQLTKEEHGRFLALEAKTMEMQTKLDRVHGTVGGVNEIVKKLQAATPAGVTVEYDDGDFAELEADYPDIAGRIKAILQKGKVKGTAADEPKSAKSVAEQLKELKVEETMQVLDEVHPKWKETVGYSQTEEERKTNPYRIWLAAEDEDYQKLMKNTQSALTIARSIDRFHRAQRKAALLAKKPAPPADKKPDPKVVARQDRIAGSVQPRGDARPPPRKDTSTDEFLEGFHGRT